jgi:hypothetical protein
MPSSSQQKTKSIRVSVEPDKQNSGTRNGRAQVVGSNGPNSAIWKSTPEVQAAGTKLVTAGTALADVEALIQSLQSQIATALNLRAFKTAEFDAAYGVYAATVEAYATTAQDVTALGLSVFTRSTHALAPPIGTEATFDATKGQIRIRVHKAPGMQASVVEISPEATGAGP